MVDTTTWRCGGPQVKMKVVDDWPTFDLGMMTSEEWAIWKSVRRQYRAYQPIRELLE